MKNNNSLKNKWVEVIDTVCEGGQATKDDQERVALYDSEDEVAREVMDCITECSQEENYPYINEMEQLAKTGTASQILEFLAKHDEVDTRDMSWMPAGDYIDGRKAIWAKDGLHIIGTPIDEMEASND